MLIDRDRGMIDTFDEYVKAIEEGRLRLAINSAYASSVKECMWNRSLF